MAAVQPQDHLYPRRLGRSGHLQHPADQLVGRDILEAEGRVLPGQVRQARDDGLGLAGGVVNLQHAVVELRVLRRQLFQRQNAVAHDGGEQVVELVRDAGGQGADGLQPLMVGQLPGLPVKLLHGLVLLPQHRQLPEAALIPPTGPDGEHRQQHDSGHHHAAVGQKPDSRQMQRADDPVVVYRNPHRKEAVGLLRGREHRHAGDVGLPAAAVIGLVEGRALPGLLLVLHQIGQTAEIAVSRLQVVHQVHLHAVHRPVEQGLSPRVQQHDAILGPDGQVARHPLVKALQIHQRRIAQPLLPLPHEGQVDPPVPIHARADADHPLSARLGRKAVVGAPSGGEEHHSVLEGQHRLDQIVLGQHVLLHSVEQLRGIPCGPPGLLRRVEAAPFGDVDQIGAVAVQIALHTPVHRPGQAEELVVLAGQEDIPVSVEHPVDHPQPGDDQQQDQAQDQKEPLLPPFNRLHRQTPLSNVLFLSILTIHDRVHAVKGEYYAGHRAHRRRRPGRPHYAL